MTSKYLLILSISILGLFSCSNGADKSILSKKQAELDKLIQSREDLDTKITNLEAEIAKLDTSTQSKGKPKLVSTKKIESENFSSQVEIMGKIDVDENASISSAAAGLVRSIAVKEGNYVRKGQILARLDNDLVFKNIDQVRQQLKYATEIYNKQKNLWDQKIGSEVQYLNAKNNKESLEANLNTLAEQADMYNIRALYNGVIDKVNIKVGQTMAPGMPAFTVVGTSGMKLIASVPESYIGKIKSGSSVAIDFPDINKEVNGKVHYISQIVNPLDRTFDTEILIPGSREIKTNMVGIIRIKDYNRSEAIAIPINMLLKNESGYYVYVVDKSGPTPIAKETNIKTGVTNGTKIEVLSGIKPGDEIISVGFQDITDGDLLSISK